MQDNQHEQLFTELTPEQASVIQGGREVNIKSIKCNYAGADSGLGNNDDIYIKVGTESIWGPNAMDNGVTALVNTKKEYGASTWVSVYDSDPGRDDLIGRFRVNGPYGGPARTVRGNGSSYSIDFTST